MENSWPGITTLNQAERGRAAQAYAAGGLPVFPVFWVELGQDNRYRCACGDIECDRPGKHPLARWKSEATADPDIVHDWWARWPQANIGIPTGAASNLLVLDLDRRSIPVVGEVDGRDELERWCEENHVPWPLPTLEQRTGGGGTQLVLRHVEGARTLTAWLPAVDVRAEGGYILAPPSGHISGGAYAWLNEHGPLEAPERLAAVLRVARGHATGQTSSGQTVDYDYGLAKLEGPPPGARDHFFNSFAFELRSNGVERAEAERRVTELWERCDHDAGGGFSLGTALEKVARVWHDVPAGEARGSVTTEEINIARQLAERALGNGHAEGTVVQGPWPDNGGGEPRPPWIANEPPRETLTDEGNARRFARLASDQVRYANGLGWFMWTGTHWQHDVMNGILNLAILVVQDLEHEAERTGDDTARVRVLAWAHQSQMLSRMKAMLERASALPELAIHADQLDALPYFFNTPAGEFDLRTNQLLPHTREHLLTRITNVSPSTVGSSKPLEEFFLTFMPPDPNRTDAKGVPDPWQDRKYFMRLLGSCLWAGNRHRRLFVMHGPTTSGKSTMASMLELVMGSHLVTVNPSVLRGSMDDKPRPDLINTKGARACIMHEGGTNWELHPDAMKKFTGEDTMSARRMRSDTMLEWKTTCTPIIVANEMPHLKGIDPALKRRVQALPFVVQVPALYIDPHIKEELLADPEVPPALLAEMLQGSWAQQQVPSGRLEEDLPSLFAIETAKVVEEMDDVQGTLAAMIEHGWLIRDDYAPASHCIKATELYHTYKQFIVEFGSKEQIRNIVGIKEFGRKLREQNWMQERSSGLRWMGLRLPSSIEEHL